MSKGDSQLVEVYGEASEQKEQWLPVCLLIKITILESALKVLICDFYPTYTKTRCPRMDSGMTYFLSFPGSTDIAGTKIYIQRTVI